MGKYVGKNFGTALLLSIFFGGFGFDRFYLGHVITGILKFMTFGGFGFWWLYDIIKIIINRNEFRMTPQEIRENLTYISKVVQSAKSKVETSKSARNNKPHRDRSQAAPRKPVRSEKPVRDRHKTDTIKPILNRKPAQEMPQADSIKAIRSEKPARDRHKTDTISTDQPITFNDIELQNESKSFRRITLEDCDYKNGVLTIMKNGNCPLTLIGVRESDLSELLKIINIEIGNSGSHGIIYPLFTNFIMKNKIVFKEAHDAIQTNFLQVNSAIEEFKQSVDFKLTSYLVKDEKLLERKREIMEGFEYGLNVDESQLYNVEYRDTHAVYSVIDYIDIESLYLLSKIKYRTLEVVIVTDDNSFVLWKSLHDKSLAYKGREIPFEHYINAIALEKFNEIMFDEIGRKLTRQNQLQEFLKDCEDPYEIISRIVPMGKAFMIKDIESELAGNLPLDCIFSYLSAVTTIFYNTIQTTLDYEEKIKEEFYASDPEGCKITSYSRQGHCNYFHKHLENELISADNIPVFPMHIGCTCQLSPVNEDN